MSKLHIRSRASRLRIPKLVIDTFEIRCMPIDELHCPVRDVDTFADEVAESIKREGMANPVIVVRGPREDLIAQLQAMGSAGTALPDKPVLNCVYGGTNRVSAARKLGYTHIDCILLPEFMLGLRLQDMQRSSYSASKAEAVGQQ